jgi:site-specific DNA recombinase
MPTSSGAVDAIYARYSSHKQDDSTSIEVQVETCRNAAGGPCAEYIDRARTGRTIGGRDELRRLIKDAEAGRIKRLFVYKFDRIGRAAETHVIVSDLEECGVEVISATEGKEALSRGVQLVVAEHNIRALAERTRAGLVKRHEQRSWTGGEPPFGYKAVRADDGRSRLTVNPEEAEVVRGVFHSYLSESVGFKAMAARLHDRGVPTRRGARWAHTSIRAILVNPTYKGEVRYGARRMKLNRETGRRVPCFNPAAEHKVYTDDALQIIDPLIFDRVQETLAGRAKPTHGHRVSRGLRPFTGFLFCDECGSVYYSRKSENAKGTYHYYNCGCRQVHGKDACPNSRSVREDHLMSRVMDACAGVFEDADAIVADVLKEAEKMTASRREQIGMIRRQLYAVEEKINRTHELLIDPSFDKGAMPALSRKLAEMEQERERLNKAMGDAADQANDGTERLAANVRRAFDEARENFTTITTPAQLHRFVEDFVGPMTVKADGTIHPRAPETTTAPAVA